jgi:hypothetical protein
MNEIDQLGHKLAYDYAAGLIEGCAEFTQGDGWFDVSSLERDDLTSILEAVHYLDLRGLIERRPNNPNVVRVLEPAE